MKPLNKKIEFKVPCITSMVREALSSSLFNTFSNIQTRRIRLKPCLRHLYPCHPQRRRGMKRVELGLVPGGSLGLTGTGAAGGTEVTNLEETVEVTERKVVHHPGETEGTMGSLEILPEETVG